jgi:lipopolysaccharide/colanic/teichoic acid biosynthesis glycosyltransferase
MYRRFFKRTLDVAGAIAALAATLPVTLPLAVALSVANGGSPLFTQRRSGLRGEIFRIIKFKTMNDACDASGAPLPDNARTHRLGRWLRRTSLDELPQMLNVLRGEMSFIGPRPLLERYLPLYDATQARRHEVRPGMTGLAQTRGRNTIAWDERFALDVWYVDNLSFALDVRIAAMTIGRVLRREGVEAEIEPFDQWKSS